MNGGRFLAILIAGITAALIVVGTLWPISSASAMAASGSRFLRPSSSPQAAVQNLADEIGRHDWERAYSSLANKTEFTDAEFMRDLSGTYPSLRTYATLDGLDVRPLHATANEAQVQLNLRWSCVVGTF